MQKIVAYSLVLLVIIAALLLYFEHPLLRHPVLFGIPFGSLISWAGLVALPAAQLIGLYHKTKRDQDPRIGVFYIASLGALTLSLLWGALSYGLSGNWAFVFNQQQGSFVGSNEAESYFVYLSAATAALPLLILLLYLIYRSL